MGILDFFRNLFGGSEDSAQPELAVQKNVYLPESNPPEASNVMPPEENAKWVEKELTQALEELDSGDPDLLWDAVRALGELGPDGEPAVPTLLDLLVSEDDEETREYIVQALGDIEVIPAESCVTIPTLYRIDSMSARDYASHILEENPDEADRFLGPLIELTNSPDTKIVEYAAYGIGLLGEGAAPALPRLEELSQSSEPGVAKEAKEAMGKIKDFAE